LVDDDGEELRKVVSSDEKDEGLNLNEEEDYKKNSSSSDEMEFQDAIQPDSPDEGDFLVEKLEDPTNVKKSFE
jgi:hypothetical protein